MVRLARAMITPELDRGLILGDNTLMITEILNAVAEGHDVETIMRMFDLTACEVRAILGEME